jgi:excinuclease ABC subunit C
VRELFVNQVLSSFGPHALAPGVVLPLIRVEASRPAGLRGQVRLQAPRRPGVYGMLDDRGELIYVGKALCLRARLLSYFRPKSRDPKAGEIVRDTRAVVWEHAPTEFSALLRELELIRRWQPRFNVQGQPRRKRRALVCVGRRPAPCVFLAPRATASALAVFGPVPAGVRAREAVRRLNDGFRLRDCPRSQEMVFREQQELFPVVRTPGCLRHEIGTCLGPCAALCTRDEYEAAARDALAFLEGRDLLTLQILERDMQAASEQQQFERAAVLRDRLAVLSWLHACLDRLRRARRLSFVYPLRAHEGGTLWYVIHRGQVRAVLPAPGEDGDPKVVRKVLERIFGEKPGSLQALAAESVDGVLLVEAWFRRRAEEMKRTLPADEALARVSGRPG